MKENEDYSLIPVDIDNEQAWEIRILKGEFIETVIRYGNVSIDGINEQIKFNFVITFSPDEEITAENPQLQALAGEILGDLIENHIENGSIILDDK